ncbi:MAG: hypothetical protein GDA54_01840 [Alphaproteobacteria bacterium GM7ARS4]|nr:hypothetical protein [Alphaproteobacteria bacterium GM7ARS4]
MEEHRQTKDSRHSDNSHAPTGVVILARPQLGVNIGAVARAMGNCGVTRLRLVSPRPTWSKKDAIAMACHSASLIHKAQIFPTTQDALSDLHYVLATTARPRTQHIPVLDLDSAITTLHKQQRHGHGLWGVLFGCERSGLTNEEVSQCHGILHIHTHPLCPSLNIAQAVLLVCYHWYRLASNTSRHSTQTQQATHATASHRHRLFFLERLETMLTEKQFFHHQRYDSKKTTIRLRNMLARLQPTHEDIDLLHALVTCLTSPPTHNNKDFPFDINRITPL